MKAAPGTAHAGARADGKRFVVVAARFNGEIVQRLVDGAVDAVKARGGTTDVVWVPGALEIPLVAQRAAQKRRPAGVICVGCVIKGGTDHYEHVCRATTDGILRAGLDTGVPVTNGVLTVATVEQARERAGGAVGNKGEEAALAAVDVAAELASWA